jgi:hypothetical protein
MISNTNLLAAFALLFLAGIAIGYCFCRNYANVAKNYQIKYIAESEIIEFEKARLKDEGINPEEQNLFFGNIDRAVELTMKIASSKNNNDTRVIFSLSPLFASGVESISKVVHEEVIEELKREKQED